MTAILGISAYYHDSAACLVRDGEILAAAQEAAEPLVHPGAPAPQAEAEQRQHEAGDAGAEQGQDDGQRAAELLLDERRFAGRPTGQEEHPRRGPQAVEHLLGLALREVTDQPAVRWDRPIRHQPGEGRP